MKIGIAQINAVLGDFKQNTNSILLEIKKASKDKVDLLVFPECALFGYHPVDLLDRPSVVPEQLKYLTKIAKSCPLNLSILVGAITLNEKGNGKPYRNSAVLIKDKKIKRIFNKELLPTYDVFDEGRHIEPGSMSDNTFKFGSKNILVTICEDIWAWPLRAKASAYKKNPLLQMFSKKIDLVINLSASPTTANKLKWRRQVCKLTAQHLQAPMVYVNLVGGQDELIFDGGSLYLNEKGQILFQARRFEPDYHVIDLQQPRAPIKNIVEVRQKAILLGIRDFCKKTGIQKVHLGSSGGIDSALVACLAVDALGPENVTTIALPGPFNDPNSARWAKELSQQLGCHHFETPITPTYKALLKTYSKVFNFKDFGLVNENMQARIRGLILMAFSNQHQSLLLGTSNKSELAIGYSTLYGDLCGGLLPIGDLLKQEVYALAEHYHSLKKWIPRGVLDRAPSAELRPYQTDQQTLPAYPVLDQAIQKLVENKKGAQSKLDQWVLQMMIKSEFKRWQAPPILKVSDHAFGRGRRFPIAHRAKG